TPSLKPHKDDERSTSSTSPSYTGTAISSVTCPRPRCGRLRPCSRRSTRARTSRQRARRLSEGSRSCVACASPGPPSWWKRQSRRRLPTTPFRRSTGGGFAPTTRSSASCARSGDVRVWSGRSLTANRLEPRRGQAAPHCRHGVVDQTISEHWAAEGPPDERSQLEPVTGAAQLKPKIAVGTPITEHPPHRSVRARFGHTAPTLGD